MGCAVAMALVATPSDVAAQEIRPTATPKGQYRTLNSLPDWGGVWVMQNSPEGIPEWHAEAPQLKGKYLEAYEEARRFAAKNNQEAPRTRSYCAAPGLPYIMRVGQYPLEFLFTPGRVTILFEAWTAQRRIFTDGRPHPATDDLELSAYGHSIGRWEGDVLVVDTVGFKPDTVIAAGVTHSDKMHITERMYLDKSSPDMLIDEITVVDPEALAKPFHLTYHYKRQRDLDLMEYVCVENDRNPLTESGISDYKLSDEK